jgi:hypothetical protein
MKRLVSVALAGLCLTLGNPVRAQDIPKDAALPTDNTYVNTPGASQFPGANAVFLSDDVVFRVSPDGSTTYDEHDIVKVFTPAGVEEHKDLVRVYRSDLEKVEVVRARTILPDGRVMEIPKAAVVDEPVFDKDETTTKTSMRRLVLRYPAVAANCIIEFHLRTTRKAYPGNKWWAVSYVQNPDPMVESKFTVEVPRGTRWRWAAPGLPALSPEKTEVGDYERSTWVVRQSPALNQEAAAPGLLTQMRRIEVSNFENWAELRSWFDQAFEQSVDVAGPTQAQSSALVGNLTRATDKIEAVAGWVTKKRFLTGGLDDFRPRRASELVEEKVLNQVDGAVLMAGLLRAAGLTVQPVLAFEQPPEEMSSALPRFNRVDSILLRVSSGSESWWVDPRHPLEYTSHAPSGFQGGSALQLASTEQPFERLQVTDADANRVVTDIEARLDEKGKLELRFHTTEHGDSGTVYREASRELLESGKDERDTNLQRLFDRIARNYSARARVLEKYFSLEARQGEPIDFSATLSLPDYAVRLGDKMALPLPIRLNPQLVGLAESDEPRQHPVRLDHPWREEHRMRLHLPAGAQVNELPPTVHLKSPFGEYFATARSQGKEIYYYSRLVVNDAWVPRAQAGELSDFAKKVVAARSKPVVLNLPKTAQSGR